MERIEEIQARLKQPAIRDDGRACLVECDRQRDVKTLLKCFRYVYAELHQSRERCDVLEQMLVEEREAKNGLSRINKVSLMRDYDYFKHQIYCPYCGNENTHTTGHFVNDPRFPGSAHGNFTIEFECEFEPKKHKWLIGAVEHKGHTWLIQLSDKGEEITETEEAL